MKPNIRRCLACRKIGDKAEFWRIVRNFPDHNITLNVGMGRSAYLCPCENCLKVAQKKNRLGKTLKAPIPDSLYTTLSACLAQETPSGDRRAAITPPP